MCVCVRSVYKAVCEFIMYAVYLWLEVIHVYMCEYTFKMRSCLRGTVVFLLLHDNLVVLHTTVG